MKKILFVFGTRPEAIKMAPLVKILQQQNNHFNVKVCTTGQHKEMLQQAMDFFGIVADYELQLMKHDQTLFQLTSNVLLALENILNEFEPDAVLVQGDTTTAYAGALAAYYKKIKVGHIEAGLRSFNKYSPFPEEVNRKMISVVTDYHFAPTEKSKQNLIAEGFNENIFVTGNTVIDALLWGVEKVRADDKIENEYGYLKQGIKTILVTGHRRESFGKAFEDICDALSFIAKNNKVQIVYPVHLNPNVKDIVYKKLSNHKNIFLIEPVNYPHLIWLMDKSYLVLTDSGGIQEEAPSLGKPVLVMRDVTEREEGITANTSKLVGTNKNTIIKEVEMLLNNDTAYKKMANAVNPYGTGNSAEIIAGILKSV